MMKKIYIDADSIIYRAAHLSSAPSDMPELPEEGEGEEIDLADSINQTEQLDEAIRIFNSMVREIVIAVEDDSHYKKYEVDLNPILVITVKTSLDVCEGLEPNFRYKVMEAIEDEAVKGYKANRVGMDVPDGLNDLYTHVFNMDNSLCVSGVEADDVVVYYGNQGHIVVALDKDVLGSLEYAYNFGKKIWVENSAYEVAIFPYYQTITGDSSDGLRGAVKIGPVGANKALHGKKTELELWTAVVTAYFSKGQSLEEAIATMRCVNMNQWTPENGLVLWNPPARKDN